MLTLITIALCIWGVVLHGKGLPMGRWPMQAKLQSHSYSRCWKMCFFPDIPNDLWLLWVWWYPFKQWGADLIHWGRPECGKLSLKSHCFISALCLFQLCQKFCTSSVHHFIHAGMQGCCWNACCGNGHWARSKHLWCLLVWAQGLDLKVICGCLGGTGEIGVVSLQ